MERTPFFGFQFKSVGEAGSFTGYASTFGNEDLVGDVVARGAFKRTLAANGGRVPILMSHNPGIVVGFGTAASEDSRGLAVEGEFTLASDAGRNAYATIQHAAKVGHAFGLSIGYGIPRDGFDFDSARQVRTLKDIDLYEYSLAATPANPAARITGVKDITARTLEELFRTGGMSQSLAKKHATDTMRLMVGMDEKARFLEEIAALTAEFKAAA